MTVLQNKIDFAVVLSVHNANPNGDPLNGNRPRQNYDGHGEITDVAIKRKIRNRLQDMGESIFVQANERTDDGFKSLRERADANENVAKYSKGKNKSDEKYAQAACKEWIDVRSFGQVFDFSGGRASGGCIGVRGSVSICSATSVGSVGMWCIQ